MFLYQRGRSTGICSLNRCEDCCVISEGPFELARHDLRRDRGETRPQSFDHAHQPGLGRRGVDPAMKLLVELDVCIRVCDAVSHPLDELSQDSDVVGLQSGNREACGIWFEKARSEYTSSRSGRSILFA